MRLPATPSSARPATRPVRRPSTAVTTATGAVLALALVAGTVPAATAAPVRVDPPQPPATFEGADVVVTPDPGYQHEAFEGWGTALVWFANATGDWPLQEREALADLLYGEEGLGFTVARYNIGGGNAPETPPYLRPGADVPGLWARPAEYGPPPGADATWRDPGGWWDPTNPEHWDYDADAAQQWWLGAAKERGADVFEAFSNSPPYFMTRSGVTSGNVNAFDDNLRADSYEDFADYLVGSVQRIEAEAGIEVRTLSPINEPNNGYWRASGRQEGSNWQPASQERILRLVDEKLRAAGEDTVVSGMDETNPDKFRTTWDVYSQATKDALGQLNTHTYGTGNRTSVRDISKLAETPLWMSEVDLGPSGIPQDFDDIRPGLALSERITDDITELEPSAWVMWQAVEDYVNMRPEAENMNWGLVQVDLRAETSGDYEIRVGRKYYAMAQYSRFIRPGDHVVGDDDEDSLAAVTADGSGAVVVHTNATAQSRSVGIDLSGFGTVSADATVTPVSTSPAGNLIEGDPVPVVGRGAVVEVEPQSVTTFVVDGVSGASEAAVAGPGTVTIGSGSAVLGIGSAGAVLQQRVTDADAQEWVLERTDAGDLSHRATWTVRNVATGALLTSAPGNVLTATQAPSGPAPTQEWILSTRGDGEHVLVNAATDRVADVYGSRSPGTRVGLWVPNSGANQRFVLRPAGVVSVEDVVVATRPALLPALPSTVTVRLDGDRAEQRPVVWEPLAAADVRRPGWYRLGGTVDGTDLPATLYLAVTGAVSVVPPSVVTARGYAPQLPATVLADVQGGGRAPLDVVWKAVDPAAYESLGTFTVRGRTTVHNRPVTLTVEVLPSAPENVALSRTGSAADLPRATATWTGLYDDPMRVLDGRVDAQRWTNWTGGNPGEPWHPSDTLTVELDGAHDVLFTRVHFYDDLDGTRPPATLLLQQRDAETGVWSDSAAGVVTVEPGGPLDVRVDARVDAVRLVMTARAEPTVISVNEVEVFVPGDGPEPWLP